MARTIRVIILLFLQLALFLQLTISLQLSRRDPLLVLRVRSCFSLSAHVADSCQWGVSAFRAAFVLASYTVQHQVPT